MKSFVETEFVIFDVETTGLSPHTGDRIIEIAALKIKDMKAVERFDPAKGGKLFPDRAVVYVKGIDDIGFWREKTDFWNNVQIAHLDIWI